MIRKLTALRLAIALMFLTNPLIALANTNVVPVRFLHNITTKDINQGDAIPLEIIHDINIDGHKIFAQGGAGYAHIDEVQKARWLGRGGKITISRGVIVDTLGNTHNVVLSHSSKGAFDLGSAAGALSIGAIGSDIIEAGAKAGSISGTLLGVGAGLGAASFLLGKGKEASIGRGKVMFAHLESPITVAKN